MTECFLRIPQKLLLHAGLAVECKEYIAIFKALEAESISSKGAKLDERLILCLLLLLERARGSQSIWHEYIAILPRTYGGLPLHLPPDNLRMSHAIYDMEFIDPVTVLGNVIKGVTRLQEVAHACND